MYIIHAHVLLGACGMFYSCHVSCFCCSSFVFVSDVSSTSFLSLHSSCMYEYYLPTALFIIKPFPVVTMPIFILDVLVAIIISDDGYFMTETITVFFRL